MSTNLIEENKALKDNNHNCDCISKIKSSLEIKYGQGNVDLCLEMYINESAMKTFASYPPLYFTHAILGKNGKPTKKRKKCSLTFLFCPFCGARSN